MTETDRLLLTFCAAWCAIQGLTIMALFVRQAITKLPERERELAEGEEALDQAREALAKDWRELHSQWEILNNAKEQDIRERILDGQRDNHS